MSPENVLRQHVFSFLEYYVLRLMHNILQKEIQSECKPHTVSGLLDLDLYMLLLISVLVMPRIASQMHQSVVSGRNTGSSTWTGLACFSAILLSSMKST